MKILITGGLGFIGHHLSQHLFNSGHTITIVDNFTDYDVHDSHETVKLFNERRQVLPNIEIFQYDINQYSTISLLLKEKFDVIIHLASFPRQKTVEKNSFLAAKTMIEGTVKLLQACTHNTRRFIFASSSMVYGDFSYSVSEDHKCSPKGQYGILKLAGENLVRDWSKNTNIPHTIIRPSAVYGSRDISDRIVPKFLNSANNNKTLFVNGEDERIDFTHVDDLVSGIRLAVENTEAENQTFNMTRGNSRKIYEAAQVAIDVCGGGKITVRNPNDRYPSRGTLDISKAKSLLGYDPSIDIESGFEKTHGFHQQ